MILALFILGLLVGSFLNVVLFRFETGETVLFGRSRCNACRKTIAWYDNIPLLSFLVLRGRCRRCGARISSQYPVVELATAVLFAFVAQAFYVPGDLGAAIELTFALGLIATMIVIFVYDLTHMEIPVPAIMFGILWVAIGLFLRWFYASPVEPFFSSQFWEGIVGGSIAFSLFYALVFFSKETWMGMGDAWLALIIGLVLGWKLLLPALTLAFGVGALVGLVLIALKKKEMQSRIPFGPFLSGTVVFFLLFGRMVERWMDFFFWM